MADQNNRNLNDPNQMAGAHRDRQGIDKAPGEEQREGPIENVVADTQKGKNKVDGDPSQESDQPIDQQWHMRRSAGILVFRRIAGGLEFFLVHPGGPFWKGKDKGAWSLPKGEISDDEEPLEAAKREFREETGQEVSGHFIALEPVRQKAGKMVHAWAVEADLDAGNIVSNTFRVEYPYKSGKWITVTEVDAAGWFDLAEAKEKINQAQVGLLEELMAKLNA